MADQLATRKLYVKVETRTVPVNGLDQVRGLGQFVYCISSSADCTISIDQAEANLFRTGIKVRTPPGDTFSAFTVAGAGGTTYTVAYGFGNYEDLRLSISGSLGSPQTLQESADVAIVAAAAAVQLSAANTNRRAIIVCNIGGNPARVGKAPTNTQGAFVPAGGSIKLDTGDQVKGFSQLGTTLTITETLGP